MDGNRRWARARGKPSLFGHKQGAESVRRAVEACCKFGIRYLTLFAFSSENWSRPAGEVRELMGLLRFYLRKEIATFHSNGICVRVIGSRAGLDDDILKLINNAEKLTAENDRLTLVIALNYGARQELVEATRLLALEVKAGKIDASDIDENSISSALYTKDIPDPDLLVRTSGELRISNFLLWQLAYTELVFMPICWPEFTEDHLSDAIAEYSKRDRRYGASSN